MHTIQIITALAAAHAQAATKQPLPPALAELLGGVVVIGIPLAIIFGVLKGIFGGGD